MATCGCRAAGRKGARPSPREQGSEGARLLLLVLLHRRRQRDLRASAAPHVRPNGNEWLGGDNRLSARLACEAEKLRLWASLIPRALLCKESLWDDLSTLPFGDGSAQTTLLPRGGGLGPPPEIRPGAWSQGTEPGALEVWGGDPGNAPPPKKMRSRSGRQAGGGGLPQRAVSPSAT